MIVQLFSFFLYQSLKCSTYHESTIQVLQARIPSPPCSVCNICLQLQLRAAVLTRVSENSLTSSSRPMLLGPLCPLSSFIVRSPLGFSGFLAKPPPQQNIAQTCFYGLFTQSRMFRHSGNLDTCRHLSLLGPHCFLKARLLVSICFLGTDCGEYAIMSANSCPRGPQKSIPGLLRICLIKNAAVFLELI